MVGFGRKRITRSKNSQAEYGCPLVVAATAVGIKRVGGTSNGGNQIVVKGESDNEGFLLTLKYRCAWSKFVPQLSRSSLQVGHIKHNMQRMHTLFC